MNRDTINLLVFACSIAAGAGLILAGHSEAGIPLITFAVGHAGPSPFGAKGEP